MPLQNTTIIEITKYGILIHVKYVHWSCTVQSTLKDQLLRDHEMVAEVKVDYSRWEYYKSLFLEKFWYAPKRKLKEFVQELKAKKKNANV